MGAFLSKCCKCGDNSGQQQEGSIIILLSNCCKSRENPVQQQEGDILLCEAGDTPDNEQPSGSGMMTMRRRLALRKSRKEFIQDLDVKRAIDHLFSRLIITQEDKERIESMLTDHDRRRTLLDVLEERGQEAFRELCECLKHDQEWLRKSLETNYISITEEELMVEPGFEENRQTVRGTAELREALKRNMEDRLDEWKTALEEGVSNQEGLLPYINQPCSFENKISKQQSTLNTVELVEKSNPGDRLVIYGEAGMGKTTLLKHLSRSWIEGSNKNLEKKFTYVFLIPLRRVGQGTLLHTICDELKLVPGKGLEELERSLAYWEHKVLYLLDSYEELRQDVVKAKNTEIVDLISGRLFRKSTVVVTSRPGSRLREDEDQTRAQLKDLPEDKVKPIIKQHFGENEYAVERVQRFFPAMSYLQRPINLALFLFIITKNPHLTLSYTQAELFNLVLQYIMLAFAKKKNLEEFTPQPGSYLANDDIPRDIQRQFRDIAKKCFDQRRKKDVKIYVKDDDLKEYLEFGLFTPGTNSNTVVLPHQLFVEYFTAAHVAETLKGEDRAEHSREWMALFREMQRKSQKRPPRPSLPVVVRKMGLENILRFLIALSPQPQLEDVCQQLGRLFVVEREKVDDDCCNYRLVNFDYHAELVRDCSHESGRRVLATGLLNAPVRDVPVMDVADIDEEEDRSLVLFPYLESEQHVTLLKKIHNLVLDLCVQDEKSILSCTGSNQRLGIRNRDKFVVALVYKYDCVIEADALDISGDCGRHLELPASVLTRIPNARQLRLSRCTVCEGLPEYLSAADLSATLQHSSPLPTNSSLESIVLEHVEGLELCDAITSCQCQLEMKWCGDIRASALKTWFPKVSELKLDEGYIERFSAGEPIFKGTPTAVYGTEEELTSWLSTVHTVRQLRLTTPLERELESLSLCRLLNILAEKEKLEYLRLERYTFLSDVSDTSNTVKQNNTLSELRLSQCEADLGQLLEVWDRQCPKLKRIEVWHSDLSFDEEKVMSTKHLQGLNTFSLQKSHVYSPAAAGHGPRVLSDGVVLDHLRRLLCPSAVVTVKELLLCKATRLITQRTCAF